MSSSGKLRIPLKEISSATNGFAEANIIGKGGYGLVYSGQSEQHGKLAIKRLNRVNSGQGDHEYGMEVTLLSKYKHENLVCLIGFCGEGDEKILVYKYEENQSLDKCLHSKDLSWIRRLHICLGAARGLRYLHDITGSGHGVIHRDIKSSNILLDENWNAKISDFGLSKISLTNSADSVVFTTPCGTHGYVDPQILYGGITQKSDVYSFGVVLFEVLFGKLVAIPEYRGLDRFTVRMAKLHYEAKTLHMMIDPHLRYQMNSNSLRAYSTIAYQCLEIHTEDRPTMSLVVDALERALFYQQASSGFLYDVYISSTFGVETENIVNCLYDALRQERFSICTANIKSSFNKSELLSVIKQSRNFIIVFSKTFGANDWNLDEVAQIFECEKERGSIVTSVFWNVRPYEVREQKGYFGEAMSNYNTHPRMGVWRNALLDATSVPCFIPRDDKPCQAFAKKVVAKISSTRSSDHKMENYLRRVQPTALSWFLYDVYISSPFGVETESIVNCLYDALREEGFSICTANIQNSLQKSELLSGIKQSRYFIIVFSKTFGANDWNLDEVAQIFECEKERGSFVTSVFWNVRPYDVREQKGHFGEAMSIYNTHPRIGVWRNALLDATYVPCFSPRDDRPSKAFAKKVVARISSARSSQKSSS